MNTIFISYTSLLIASGLVLCAGLVSMSLRLNVTSKLWIASMRTVVQLGLLGLVLQWVFTQKQWFVVFALLLSMILNASIAAIRRTKRRYKGIWTNGIVAVTVSSVFSTAVVLTLVIHVQPWYQARYAIPLLGMVLGNTLTGLSLCFDRLMADFDENREQIEAWLALGATHWQACRPFVADAIRTGMIPIINSMSVVGIVSLPGMMTGQILAGASPESAVRYQLIIMFMIAGATSLGTLLAGTLTFMRLVTRNHQLLRPRLHS